MHSIEWAAGLFEGEGCIREGKYPELFLGMCDYDVVAKFQQVMGVGNIYDRERPAPRKHLYCWSIRKRVDVQRLLSRMLPYLGNRRAYKALNILDDLELSV